jgi:iron only hydrogenase large subunit-like protein
LPTRYFHSVTLDREKCRGCTNCIKQCPNEAIRVREGKARILEERCIDCGECIRICPNHAKLAVTDTLDRLKEYKYTIALPAPSIYGQFGLGVRIEDILKAFISIGFNWVFEVSLAAEVVTHATRRFMREYRGKGPLISSACPAVVRFMQIHFHNLLEHIIPVDTPMEVAGALAKERASKVLGIKKEDIGAFFISPCPAKVTAIKQPVMKDMSNVDGAISISLLYGLLSKQVSPKVRAADCTAVCTPSSSGGVDSGECAQVMSEGDIQIANAGYSGSKPNAGQEVLCSKDDVVFASSGAGIGWGRAGGEAHALGEWSVLAVDGIHNVQGVLEQLERKEIEGIDFIEAQACTGGCVGGCLSVQNPFVARARLRAVSEKYWNKRPLLDSEWLDQAFYLGTFRMKKVEPRQVMVLDEDVTRAIAKMDTLEKTVKGLPGLDCGSCGAPNCRSLAEDIVRGIGVETDCTFKLREKVKALAEEMADLAGKIPPAMGVEKSGGEGSEGEVK